MRILKLASVFLLAFAACFGLQSCGGPSKGGGDGKPGEKFNVKIGANLELGGESAEWGKDSLQGMQMAVDEINADAKNNFKLELVAEDNNSDPAKSQEAVKKLINQEHVNVVLGAVGSNRTKAAISVAKEEQIPMITHASTNVEITKLGGEYVSRICFNDDFQGDVMARFALEYLKIKTVVLVEQKGNTYSEGLIKSFRATFTAKGGQIVGEESYQKDDKDFSTLVAKLKATAPDAVWVPGYFNEVALIIKQARIAGFQKPFLGADGWDGAALYTLGAPEIKGNNFFSNHFDANDDNPKVKEFVTKYEARYKTKPSAMATLGYDAVYCVADAARRAGSNDPVKLMKAINSLKDVETVCGKITMGPDREVIKPAVIQETGEKEHKFVKRQ